MKFQAFTSTSGTIYDRWDSECPVDYNKRVGLQRNTIEEALVDLEWERKKRQKDAQRYLDRNGNEQRMPLDVHFFIKVFNDEELELAAKAPGALWKHPDGSWRNYSS